MVAIPMGTAGQEAAPGATRLVLAWLGLLILLVFAMVLVGGATRLTESGLSITQWNLVSGVIPPIGEGAWREAFDLYRHSSQYELLNRGMSLEEFRRIFWWEWAHRELGRFIGLFYTAGFLWLAFSRKLPPRFIVALAGMEILLGAQGFVGWVMVASGLEEGMIAVAPVKLALHLTLAALFFAALVAVFVRLGARREAAPAGTRIAAYALILLAFVQVALGGLVAGHDAGLTYNTWPMMDGRLIPQGLWLLEPAWRNLTDNVATVQFLHRAGAYVLAAALLAHAVAARGEGPVSARAILLSALVLGQVALGVATLVLVVPMGLALAHQGIALVLLFALVWHAAVMGRERRCSV